MVNHLSLYELNSMVRDIISMSLPDSYWVEAELSEAREGYGGHCYMELIEKDEHSNTPIAKAHASCWRNRWLVIKPQFERVTGQRIHAGMKVLLKVHAQFHENYGFSWIVDDIDATYTMGDMARKRMEIIQTLKEEGVFDLQKELTLPMFCQRIAVISSATAAGYGDFCNQLADNGYGLQFSTALFPATMQGEGVEQSVISALNRINDEWEEWDCVVIIRGGGATSDLSGFDTLSLAENVANFPLPIITGIGHERDESVLDMISFQRVKTPTAAAAFLVDHLTEVYARIEDAQEAILNYVKRRLQVERMRLDRLSQHIPTLFSLVKVRQNHRLDQLLQRLLTKATRVPVEGLHHLDLLNARLKEPVVRKMEKERYRMEMLSQRAIAQDPERLLSRGYSITLKNGKSVKNAAELEAGDEIETRFAKGAAKAVVKESSKHLNRKNNGKERN